MAEGFLKKTADFFGLGNTDLFDHQYVSDDYTADRHRRDDYRDDHMEDRYAAERRAADVPGARSYERPVERADYRDDRYEPEYVRGGEPRGASAGYASRVSDDYPAAGSARMYGSERGNSRAAELTEPAVAQAPQSPSYVYLPLGSYQQASELVEPLRDGEVVVFTLSGMEKEEAKRVLDFATGLSKGLDAKLGKLKGVRNFYLSPSGVSLTKDQLDQLADEM